MKRFTSGVGARPQHTCSPDHPAEGRAATLHPAHHPQHWRLEQLCGEEGAQWLGMQLRLAQESQGTWSRLSTVPRPLSPSSFPRGVLAD